MTPTATFKWFHLHLPTSHKQERFLGILKNLRRILVCFSGNLESTYLLWGAQKTLGANNVMAITAAPGMAPEDRRQVAVTAATIGARHQWIEMEESKATLGPEELYRKAFRIARAFGMTAVDAVCHGENPQDKEAREAALKWHLRLPLEEAGLSREEIRLMAMEAHLPNWNKPRIRGASSEDDARVKIEKSESFLRRLGFSRPRVKSADKITAKIEVGSQEFYYAVAQAPKIRGGLAALGFPHVHLDLRPKIELNAQPKETAVVTKNG